LRSRVGGSESRAIGRHTTTRVIALFGAAENGAAFVTAHTLATIGVPSQLTMALEYERDDKRRRIIVRFAGPLTADDAGRVADRNRREQVWDYAIVYDLSRVTSTPNRHEIQRIADYVQQHAERRPCGPVAIIAPNAVLFALARMYAAFARLDVPLNVFRNAVDAERWLDTAVSGAHG